jgi:hypothetical protein
MMITGRETAATTVVTILNLNFEFFNAQTEFMQHLLQSPAGMKDSRNRRVSATEVYSMTVAPHDD